MNRLSLPLASATMTLALAILAIPAAIPAFSQMSATSSQYQWLITINTKSAPNVFNYPGANLTPVSEAAVTVCAATAGAQPAAYETFWGAKGKPLAQERSGALGIPAGQSVAFSIVHDASSPDFTQTQLGVDALLRTFLDTQINSNQVLYVTVPTDTYSDVVNALIQQNFVQNDENSERPVQSSIVIFIVDQSGQMKTNLYY
jgi:hypothetical protein